MTSTPAAESASRPVQVDHRAVAGVIAVLLGAFLSSFSGRLDSVALADLRGAVGAGIDEAAWIPTLFGATQMFIAPIAIWLGRIVSINRLLLFGLLLFAVSQALMVFATTPGEVLVLQVIAGLGSGVFFPVTIGYIVTVLPRRFVPIGLAAYALNLGLSINLAATLEGWFDAAGDWRWIFALNVVLALVAMGLVHVAVPRPPVDRTAARNVDVVGLTVAPTALAMLYVALDQGERVDWLNSAWLGAVVICALVLLAIFALHKGATRRTGFELGLLGRRNIAAVLLVLATSRSLIAANALLLQLFLATVANHRPLQYGHVFLWLLLPQLLLAPLMAYVLPRVNARAGMALGVAIIVFGFVAMRSITAVWHEPDFMGAQLLQGVGQTILLTSTLWFAIQHFKPADAMSFGAFLQIARLFGGEIGTAAFMAAIRHGEHVASNVIGQHLSASDPSTIERLASLGAALAPGVGSIDAPSAALAVLAQSVRAQAATLATANTVFVCIIVGVAELLLIALLRRPPGGSTGRVTLDGSSKNSGRPATSTRKLERHGKANRIPASGEARRSTREPFRRPMAGADGPSFVSVAQRSVASPSRAASPPPPAIRRFPVAQRMFHRSWGVCAVIGAWTMAIVATALAIQTRSLEVAVAPTPPREPHRAEENAGCPFRPAFAGQIQN